MHSATEAFTIPASYGQEQLWFLQQADPESCAYHMASVVRVYFSLDETILRRAVDDLCLLHEALRTTLEMDEESGLLQVVHPQSPSVLHVHHCENGDVDHVAERIQMFSYTPIDLSAGPLLRIGLWYLPANEVRLSFTIHHIVCDGWSLSTLVEQLSKLYVARQLGNPSDISVPSLHFGDFAVWERNEMESVRGHSALEQAVERWSSHTRQPQLREKPDSFRNGPAARYKFSVPVPRNANATAFEHVLACWVALLCRHSGSTSVSVGTIMANRSLAEFHTAIGYFANTTPLLIDLPDGGYQPVLQAVRASILTAMANPVVPYALLLNKLRQIEGSGFQPLFQSMVVFQETPKVPTNWLEPLHHTSTETKFDLLLNCIPADGLIHCVLEYDSGLFEYAFIEELSKQFLRISTAWLDDPEIPVSDLVLLSQDAILALTSNISRKTFPITEGLNERFRKQARLHADRIAISCGEHSITYAELDARADQVAVELATFGISADTLVGVCLPRSIDLIIAILGVLRAGGAYLPLAPESPAERLSYILNDASPKVILAHDETKDVLGTEYPVLSMENIYAASQRTLLPSATFSPANLAYVIYTSGSTGKPKGVLISHENVCRLIDTAQECFDFHETDVWTMFHSVTFDFSVWEIWGALLHGGRLVIVPFFLSRSPDEFLSLIETEGVTVLNQTPSAFRGLAACDQLQFRTRSLRYVIFGGEALDFRILKPWVAMLGTEGPVLINMYGITETTVHVTFRRVKSEEVESVQESLIGVPLCDLSLYLLDASLRPTPTGAIGELYVGGAGLARGYLNRPDLTAERFLPDPFSLEPGSRLYRSGDLAVRLPAGELAYSGRGDNQVKIRGFRIEVGEVESALRSHPAIADAVVECVTDAAGQACLIAYLVARDGAIPQIDSVRQYAGRHLPDYMWPSAYYTLDSLPLTGNGKLDRQALKILRVAPASTAYAAPRNRVETVLCNAFTAALGLPEVGIRQNFFEIGGNSLLALRVQSEANRNGVAFAVSDLFRFPVVEELATRCKATSSLLSILPAPFSLLDTAVRDTLPSGMKDAYPLSALQAGMLYSSLDNAQDGIYHNVFRIRLRGKLTTATLRQALNRLAAAHAILRSSLHMTGYAVPLQLVHPEVCIPLESNDWTFLQESELALRTAQWMENERIRSFAWSQAPLLRFTLNKLSGGRFDLIWAEHHAILDGWSVARLFADLLSCRTQEVAPRPNLLPSHIRAEQEALASSIHRDFWQSRIVNTREPQLSSTESGYGVESIQLGEIEVRRLRMIATAAGTPFKSVLLAVHLKAWSLACGDGAVVTGYILNTRPEIPDADRALGLFLNTVPVSCHLSAETSLEEAAQLVWREEQELWPFRHFPYSRMVSDFGLSCESAFNFVNFEDPADNTDEIPLERIELEREARTSFAWLADFQEHGHLLTAEFSWNRACIPNHSAERMLSIYRSILLGCVPSPVSVFPLKERLRTEASGRRSNVAVIPHVAARFEVKVAAIFASVLGLRLVDAGESFFDLGGDSIRALRLVLLLQQDFDVDIPPSLLLQYPTPHGIALALQKKLESRQLTPVLLNEGREAEAVFLFPGADGELLAYRDLAMLLPPQLSVFGMPCAPSQWRPYDLRQCAQLAADTIERHICGSSFHLVGWSMGGVLAFETARILLSSGVKKYSLSLLDSALPTSGPTAEFPLAAFALSLGVSAETILAQQDIIDTTVELQIERLCELLPRENRLASSLDQHGIRSLFDTFALNSKALSIYEPRRYDGRLSLIRACRQGTGNDDVNRWKSLATAVDVREIDATHFSLLRPPAVQHVADVLSRIFINSHKYQ